jgi:tetratricopeptide (TPR) repeat protein
MIAREIGDRNGEGRTLINLGVFYYSLSDYNQAINYYQQGLTILREIGQDWAQELALLNLCKAFSALGDYNKAIEYNQQHLALIQPT